MNVSPQINELAAALAKAQGLMKPAVFDKENPHFQSKFASLSSIMDSCRVALSSNGLAIVQGTQPGEKGLLLITMLMHSSGQYISSSYPVSPVRPDPQGYGSAMTYARRYSLASLLGIVSEEDDDANLAQDKPMAPKQIQNKAPINKPVTHPAQVAVPSAVVGAVDSRVTGTPTGRDPMVVPDPRFSSAPAPDIKAAMRAAQPNHDPVGEFSPSFGKYKGQKLKDITVYDLENYIRYLEGSSRNDGKPISKNAAEFIAETKKFLDSRDGNIPRAKTDEEIAKEFADAQESFEKQDLPF